MNNIPIVTLQPIIIQQQNWFIWIQLITNIALIVGTAFLAVQIFLAIKSYKRTHERAAIEKAIELTMYYKDNILKNIGYLDSVFKDTGIEKKINANLNNLKKLVNFDTYEMYNIFNESDIEFVKSTLKKIDSNILITARAHIIDNLCDILPKEILNNKNTLDENINIQLNFEFQNIISETLNNLEYFCMYFKAKIADENTVYPTLHQTFLRNVKFLYYNIANINKESKDKYYTSVIYIFNKWSEIDCNAEKDLLEKTRSVTHKGNDFKI